MGLLRTGIVQRNVFKDGKKLFPTVLLYSNISDRELINYMLQNSQVGRSTAVAAVEAFKAAFTTFLLNGHTMVIPAVGTFSLSAKCKAVNSLDNVGQSIQRLKIRYTPENIIRVAAKSSKFRSLLSE